jgi:hypothetical protein
MKLITPARLGGGALIVATILAFSPLSPGKDVTLAHTSTWTPGHLIDLASYLFTLLGIPAIYGSIGKRSGALAALGYAAFVVRLALSAGSSLYEARVVPILVDHASLTPVLASGGTLNSIYGPSALWLSIVLSAGGVLFGVALWRSAPKMRWTGALVAVGSAAAAVIPPLGIVMFTVGFGWLGARLLRRGDATTPWRVSDEAASPVLAPA